MIFRKIKWFMFTATMKMCRVQRLQPHMHDFMYINLTHSKVIKIECQRKHIIYVTFTIEWVNNKLWMCAPQSRKSEQEKGGGRAIVCCYIKSGNLHILFMFGALIYTIFDHKFRCNFVYHYHTHTRCRRTQNDRYTHSRQWEMNVCAHRISSTISLDSLSLLHGAKP